MKNSFVSVFPISLYVLLFASSLYNAAENSTSGTVLPLVKKEQRKPIVVTKNGDVSVVDLTDGAKFPYHLQFITLEPNSLFLPVLLHAGVVFFVESGNGRMVAVNGNKVGRANLTRGDVYRLHPGDVFYIQSSVEEQQQQPQLQLQPQQQAKLKITAFFSDTDDNLFEPSVGAYSSISDLVLGFDDRILESTFMTTEGLVRSLRNASRPAEIVPSLLPQNGTIFDELESQLVEAIVGDKDSSLNILNKKIKEIKGLNMYTEVPDFQNMYGSSLTINKKDSKVLKGSNIGLFLVNLTKGSMMAPHWNILATEISMVLHGEGMIKVVCPTKQNESDCKNSRFWVKEGDVFVVPRFHPMAQMAFNNDSFVFMGFSTTKKENQAQFLLGKNSVLQNLSKTILAISFNVDNTTMHRLFVPQTDSIILNCTSCAEEEAKIMEQEEEPKEVERKEEEKGFKRQEKDRKKKGKQGHGKQGEEYYEVTRYGESILESLCNKVHGFLFNIA